ncbi:alpha/beta hydrolase [Chitinophaga lutea]|uniref:Alpha/beta hydrolase n=1 Tax=Chitinophaga lutea TaxID=2488634 RepID=A0A3N4PYB2_9BACT|nr:alpha/beta hydrolase [Chitinophaga lutea]RPE13702.1 alpha/beta hydrolase [Chitinophaga lutea]
MWRMCLLLLTAVTVQAQNIQPLDAELTGYAYPYPVQFFHFSSQQQPLRMAYMDLRPARPNGKTVLLLHGKNFCGAYWDSTAAALADKGFRVVMPDQVGFGKSTKPAHYQYSFQQLAQNTRALLDSLGIRKTAVLGHSMGGMLATRFALMYPAMTEKLILENPIGLEDWKTVVPYQQVDQWYKGELAQDYEKIKKYQLDNYYAGQWTPAYDKWAQLLAGWTRHPDYPRVAWNNALTYDMIFTQPVCYEFQHVLVPTLLIIGQRDRTALGKASAPDSVKSKLGNYPVLGRKAAAQIKNAKLVELDNVGHLPHVEAFSRFMEPLQGFLQ